MSRSYKKPVHKQRNSQKDKRIANLEVRHTFKKGVELASGSSYKKLWCRYNICDWNSGLYSKKELEEKYGDKAYKITRK